MPTRPTRIPLAALAGALVASGGLVAPAAQAAPQPARSAPQRTLPAAPAQAPVDPTESRLAVPAASGTATVDGRAMRILAALPATQHSFTLAGLTWQRGTGELVTQVRVRTDAGWQAWQTLQAEDHSSGAEGGRPGTDPTYFGTSTGVQVRVLTPAAGSGSITGARLTLIDSNATTADSALATGTHKGATVAAAAGTVQAAAQSVPQQPAIISRAQWGADNSLLSYNGSGCVTPTIDTTIKAAAVHHTEGTNSYTASQSASIVRGIYVFHVRDRGWCDIGYNFLVDKYGQVFEGRHGGVLNPVHGAHATLWNTDTVGVSVMMNSMTAQPSAAAMDSLSNVIAWKLAGYYRNPTDHLTLAGKYINRIFRHGDVMSTSCPGTNITAYMPTLRLQVAAKMAAWQTPIYQTWQQQGGESGFLGSPHILERPWNGGRTTTFTGGGIYQTPAGATRWMNASINNRYLANGFASLGWPTASQTRGTADGLALVPFEKGTIYFSAATGAHATSGAVDAWLKAHPDSLAKLGYPIGEAVARDAASGYQQFRYGRVDYSGSSVTWSPNAGRTGDQNGDGRADVVTVSSTGAVSWYPTSAAGTAGAKQAGGSLAGSFTWAQATPDLDNDNRSDLLARSSDGGLWFFHGVGNGQYTGKTKVGFGWKGMRELTVVPATSTTPPAVVAIQSSTGYLRRYNLGASARVTATAVIGHGWQTISHLASVGDLRRVGVVDVLATTADGRLWNYTGTTTGRLSGNRLPMSTGWNIYSDIHSAGDMDGDGRTDLVARSGSGPLYLYRNDAHGGFALRQVLLGDVTGLGTIA